jgi:hypothetical protein
MSLNVTPCCSIAIILMGDDSSIRLFAYMSERYFGYMRQKWPGETTREWGRPIAMSADVKQRVDALWGELGL